MTCKDGRFNTGNPICSNKPQDLHDNAMIIDAFTNSDADFVEDRFGVERLTLAGINDKALKDVGDAISTVISHGEISTYINVKTKSDLDGIDKSSLYNGQRATTSDGIEYSFNSLNQLWYPVSSQKLHNDGDLSAISSQVDWANFSNVKNRRQFVMHHYNDGEMMIMDNVGEGNILTLRNARNPNRRIDKPDDFVGTGNFVRMVNTYKNPNGTFTGSEVFRVDNNSQFVFSGSLEKTPATFVNERTGYSTINYAFEFDLKTENPSFMRFKNGGNPFLEFRNIAGNLCRISSPSTQTNGIYIISEGGQIQLHSANQQYRVLVGGTAKEISSFYKSGVPILPNSSGEVGQTAYYDGHIYTCFRKDKWCRVKCQTAWE